MDATHFMTIANLERSGALAVHGTAIEDAALALDEAPEWVMLIPAGEFSGRDGRGPFHLTSAARVIAATLALGLTAGVPIDYDHATDFAAPNGRPRPPDGFANSPSATARCGVASNGLRTARARSPRASTAISRPYFNTRPTARLPGCCARA
jgi:phage I-like protein